MSDGGNMGALPGYRKCFFCGHDEPTGVRLLMRYQDRAVTSEFTLERRFQGFDGIVHGGIITGILDELMWWTLAVEARQVSMTRKMEVGFLRPMKVETPYTAKAKLLKHEHTSYWLSCAIDDGSGQVAAKGTGVYKLIKGITFRDLISDFDFTHVDPRIKEMFTSAP
jgi:acyl-coenzyme A thioesterase PaaI-like protein